MIAADVIGVNDASTDGTPALFQKFGVRTLNHPIQMGYGTTLQTGYKYALRNGYDYVIQLDADGQHDPRFLTRFYRHLTRGDAEIVIGSRFLKESRPSFYPTGPLYSGTLLRRIGIVLFRIAIVILGWRYVSDPTSGYIGFNRRALQFFCGKGFPFDYPDADLILTLIRNRFKLMEIPVYMYANSEYGKLHRGCRPLWYIFKVSLSLLVTSIRGRERELH